MRKYNGFSARIGVALTLLRAIVVVFSSITMLSLMTACQHRIVLNHLYYPDTPGILPGFRRAEFNPYRSDGAPNPQYRLTAADLVEFKWKPCVQGQSRDNCRYGDILTATTAYEKDDIDGKSCPNSGIPAGMVLIQGRQPRIPLAVLGRLTRLVIDDPARPAKPDETGLSVDLCLPASHQFKLDLREDGGPNPPTWQSVVDIFRSADVDVSLVAEPARRAFPGDLVRTTLEWQFNSGDTADTHSVTQVAARVNERGGVLLPGLSSPSVSDRKPSDLRKSGLLREWVSDVDNAAFEIKVWHAWRNYDEQITVQRVGACLSAIWTNDDWTRRLPLVPPPPPTTPASISSVLDECWANGLESSYYSDSPSLGSNNHRVRYHLEVDQSWTLVTESERLSVRAFVPGQTVEQGVCEALREIEARECGSHSFVAVVIPRTELGPSVNDPFWGRIRRKSPPGYLASTLIAPGDVIHLTNRSPRAAHK